SYDRYSTSASIHYPEEKDIIRPFEQIKSMKRQNASRLSADDLKIGDMVEHSKFGKGQVITVEKKVATVIFESVGTKKLAIDVAPLKKL
ncbi:MAG TPA: hypothetical protein VFC96_06050, partial [Anaerovoracaceae bacterium]|nr:hypothetical protein [Anaerovoracaceae bacterium]